MARNFIVGVVYIPPDLDEAVFNEEWNSSSQQCKDSYLNGDFKIDFLATQ